MSDFPEPSAAADRTRMRAALDLAARARGRTSPNPMVGALVVRDGVVVGEGWHARAGAPHAEVVALAQAGEAARGATLYVTLEPCVHHGRTPPCAPVVRDAGVARVVVASEDPDPRVLGRGVAFLREAGLQVDMGVLDAEARLLNEAYLHRVRTGRAFGVLKAAVTLDGRLGADGGDSRWITGEAARARAHELRDAHDAVLVGRGTLERDDPALDVRLAGERRDPVAVVCDSRLAAPKERRLFRRAEAGAKVVVAAREDAPEDREAALRALGVDVLRVPAGGDGRVDLTRLFAELARRGLNSVLVEGGETMHTATLSAGLIGRAHVFVAPVLLGGRQGPRLVGDLGLRSVAAGLRLADVEHEILPPDVLISGRLVPSEGS
ncbi:MAG: bifunctional diaminohydroxyphosphoribosylaminopyrimidine deaminase/5-amino-6-(5-phosphoribosylamino)uracil reductase RibD [bacterium]